MTLLILDDDLGFLFWLAKALEPGGHAVVPANTVSQANRLLAGLELSVDLLVVNPELEGAAAFIENLRLGNPRLKVIAVVAPGENEPELNGVQADATRAKPDLSTIAGLESDGATAELEWSRFIQQVAGNRTAGGRAN